MMWRSRCIALLLVAAPFCTSADAIPHTALHYTYRLSLNDTVAQAALPCTDGVSRTLAARNQRQLVTLTSVADYCSECDRHLAGLDSVWAHLNGVVEKRFFVTYASPHAAEVIKAYRAKSRFPVCFDSLGSTWQRYGVTHTPITLIIDHGRLAFAHDGPLDDDSMVAEFAQSARRAIDP